MNEVRAINLTPNTRRETSELIEALRKGKPGDTLSDAELERVCGKNTGTGGDGYNYLRSAIKRVRKQHGLLWQRIPGASLIKCLNATECVRECHTQRKSIHRKTGRMIETAKIADAGDLNDADRADLHALTAQAAFIHELSTKAATKALEATGVAANALNMPRLLESLKGKN